MSNHCSNLFNCRSFSLRIPFRTPLKPYFTTVRPIFSFHSNFISIGRRSRRRSSSLPPPIAAESSSDIVLIATTEHRDGSLVFQFGDACEVVKKDDIVKEIGSQDEQDSDVFDESDGDQEKQVIDKLVERGYENSGRITEVADGIWNADFESDVAEKETNVINDLRDCQPEVSEERLAISVEKLIPLPSDAGINNSLEGVENIDRTECSTELDEDGSSDPTNIVLDRSLNSEDSAYPKGELLKDSDDEINDPSFSVKLESRQVLQNEVVDVKQLYAKDVMHKVEAEDTIKSDTEDLMTPSTHVKMPISDVELTDAANGDVEEELQDIIINKDALIDEMPPSHLLGSESTLDMVSELQSDKLKVEVTMDVASTKVMNVKDQDMEEKLQPVRDKSDVAYVMPVSNIKEVGTTVEEQLSDIELQDTTSKDLNGGISQVGNEDEDSLVSNLETTQDSYTEDTCESDTKDLQSPATMHNSDDELMDAANVEEGFQSMKISESTLTNAVETIADKPTLDEVSQIQSSDFKLEANMVVLSTKSMDVNDQAIDDELQQMSTENKDTNVAFEKPVSLVKESKKFVEEEVSQPQSMDVNDQAIEDEFQQMSNENQDTNVAFMKPVSLVEESEEFVEEEVSQPQSRDVNDQAIEDKFQQMSTENKDSNVVFVKPVSLVEESEEFVEEEVSYPQSMDVNDQAIEDEFQQTSTENKDTNVDFVEPVSLVKESVEFVEKEVSHSQSNPLELKPATQVSDIEICNTTGQNLDDEVLHVNNEREDSSLSVKLQTTQVSHIEVTDVTQPYAGNELHNVENEDSSEGDSEDLLPSATMHISDVELTEAANDDMEEGLQDMNISEGILIEGMLPTDSLGVEQTLNEVNPLQSLNANVETTMDFSTTRLMEIDDFAVDNDLQEVSTDDRDVNDVENVTIAESDLEDANPPHSTPVEIKPSQQASDIEVPNATCQNLDDEKLQIIDEGVNYNMLENCAESDAIGSSIQLKQAAHEPLLETERTEGKVSSSESNEASEDTASLLASKAKVEREEIYLTGYFLSSGAALLEHQFKALAGGDDAYFVAGSKWLGVASGVSQWSFEDSGPGVYAQELMKTCEMIALDTSSFPMTNPVDLLCRGVKETNISGSSNILIASFDGQALHVANIGDTGFFIIRHGAIYKKSSPLLHEFHFALQVEDSDDPLQLVEEHRIELDEGDIIVSATDGLFDNLYEREIVMIVSKSLQAGMKPEEIANVLATRAQEVGRSAFVRSPFSDSAQAAGYTGYAGGKPDNVAVIVSLVEKGSNTLSE